MRFEAPRGTHDVMPAEQPRWRRVLGVAEELLRLYGYRRIQTPGFEDTELFLRTAGAGSDVVQKEMYTFTDRAGRSLTLRPEGTAPIVRAYLEHGLYRQPQPVKLYTVAPMYRYSTPQRGRYREHWQLSVEAIGSADPAVDAEVIQLYDELLSCKIGRAPPPPGPVPLPAPPQLDRGQRLSASLRAEARLLARRERAVVGRGGSG